MILDISFRQKDLVKRSLAQDVERSVEQLTTAPNP